MSLIIKVLGLLLVGLTAMAQTQTPMQMPVQVDVANPQSVQNFINQFGQQQVSPQNCLGTAISENIAESLDQSYQAHNQQANLLMSTAATRFEHLKQCRNELQQSWIEFEKEKARHQQVTNQLESKLRDSEIAYKMAVLELEKQCRQSADQQFVEYKKTVYTQNGGMVADPTQMVGFNDRINRQRKFFYDSCYRDELNVKSVGLLGDQLKSDLIKIETEIKSSKDALDSMNKQISMIQRSTIQNCEDQDKLNDYNESLAQQMASRAMFKMKTQGALSMMSGVMACVDPGMNRAPTRTSPDATGTTL